MEVFPVTATNFKAGAQYWMDDFCADTKVPKDALEEVLNRCPEDDPRLQTLADKVNTWHNSKSKPAPLRCETTVRASDFLRDNGIHVTRIGVPKSLQEPQPKPAGHKKAAAAAPKAAKPAKPKKAAPPKKKEPAYKFMTELSEAEKVIKAFINLDGKKGKIYAQKLLTRVQTDIITRKIRKRDPLADMVMRVQRALIQIVNFSTLNTEITITNKDEFAKAVGLLCNDTAKTAAVKEFIREAGHLWRDYNNHSVLLYDDKPGAEIAKEILAKLEQAGGAACERAADYMRKYIAGERETPLYEYELNGLRGLAGI